MKDTFIKKVMAVVLGICIVVMIVWNIMTSDLVIIGLNK